MTPRTPASVSISVGPPPVAMLAATGLSTKTLFPVPINRLMVLLPVLAVKMYFPARVDQQSAVCPTAVIDVNAPLRNRPTSLVCAKVTTAVPSGYTEKPNGVSVFSGAATPAGNPPPTAPPSKQIASNL